MRDQMSDEELALGVQQGQEDPLIVLVERHYSRLKGYLYRMTGGNLPLCEDLAQETFLRVLHGIQTYQYPRPFKPWLYAIASNQVYQHFRRADTRRTHLLEDEEWGTFYDPQDQPEENLLWDAEVREVVEHLNGLPHNRREVIILRYFQGLSLLEIAAALDVPEGTVKSRLSLGLKQLRQSLKEGQHEA